MFTELDMLGRPDAYFSAMVIGGSFGVVYKGIEKATGEVVAIKHVSPLHTAPCRVMPRATVRN